MAVQQPLAQKRFFDPTRQCWHVKILPGEFYISRARDEVVSTTLGSCIAVVVFDSIAKIGGMNHFMLPSSISGEWAGVSSAARYGNYAMEHMINEALKAGALKNRMVAHIIGGGAVMGRSDEIGRSNTLFAQEYLKIESIRVGTTDVGLKVARRVDFIPATGALNVRHLTLDNNTIATREQLYTQALSVEAIENDVEIFNG